MDNKGVNYFHILFVAVLFAVLGSTILSKNKLMTEILLHNITGYVFIFMAIAITIVHTVLLTRKYRSDTFMIRDNVRLMPEEYEMGTTMSIQDNEIDYNNEESFIAKNLPLWVEK